MGMAPSIEIRDHEQRVELVCRGEAAGVVWLDRDTLSVQMENRLTFSNIRLLYFIVCIYCDLINEYNIPMYVFRKQY